MSLTDELYDASGAGGVTMAWAVWTAAVLLAFMVGIGVGMAWGEWK